MSTELIKITNDDGGRRAVSGRELHRFLEIETPYDKWFPRMVEYGFKEGEDFSSFLSKSTGGRPAADHMVSLDMAKETDRLHSANIENQCMMSERT